MRVDDAQACNTHDFDDRPDEVYVLHVSTVVDVGSPSTTTTPSPSSRALYPTNLTDAWPLRAVVHPVQESHGFASRMARTLAM